MLTYLLVGWRADGWPETEWWQEDVVFKYWRYYWPLIEMIMSEVQIFDYRWRSMYNKGVTQIT
jgi:hypothetical protein